MIPRHSIAWLSGLTALVAGCAQPWPEDLPARTYTGVVMNGSLHIPAAGAYVHAVRPTWEHDGLLHDGLLIGIYSEIDVIGNATTDEKGRFTLRTTTGYATFLTVMTSDGHLRGWKDLKPDETKNLRITADDPYLGEDQGGAPGPPRPWVDTGASAFKDIRPSLEQIIRCVAAHPHERMDSLEGYAKRGVISQQALSVFEKNGELFFGPTPLVKYSWGRDVIVMPNAHQPITFRRVDFVPPGV